MHTTRLISGMLAATCFLATTPLALAADGASGIQLTPTTTTVTFTSPPPASIPAAPIAVTPPPAAPVAPPAPVEEPLKAHITTVPKGTIMMIKLDHPVSSYSSKAGDSVTAVLEGDVYADNQIAIPAGSQLEGAITGVIPAAHMGKNGAMEIQFNALKTPNGMIVPLRAHIVTQDDTGVIKGGSDQARILSSTGVAVGTAAIGTVGGMAAGSILGSVGTGAMFGLAAGGLVGMGLAMNREGHQVVLPSGARLSIVADQPIAMMNN